MDGGCKEEEEGERRSVVVRTDPGLGRVKGLDAFQSVFWVIRLWGCARVQTKLYREEESRIKLNSK